MAGSKRNNSRSIFRRPLVIVTIAAAALLFLYSFFSVSEIEVRGASAYSEQEIIQASRIEQGDSLLFLNRLKSASFIFSKLEYVDEVNISTKFPGKVIIQITETTMMASVEQDGRAWGVDAGGLVIAEVEAQDGGLIRVVGLKLSAKPEVDQKLENFCEDADAAEALLGILKAIDSRGLAADISAIEINDPAKPRVIYGNFTVVLDPAEDCNHQLALVQNAVSQIGEKEKGTLDLTIDDRVHYIPVR